MLQIFMSELDLKGKAPCRGNSAQKNWWIC